MSEKLYYEDTIAAIATAPGEASVSIVRLSGVDALTIADTIFECKGRPPSQRKGGTFVHGFVRNALGHVDEAICLICSTPHSYTGENVAEIQGHGGSICARRILRTALEANARMADPGEFTRRAFLNGRLDLMQAEAVLDLIKAQSERASAAALEQLEGSLSEKFNRLYDELVSVAADLEATLDFPEDELPETVMPKILLNLENTEQTFSGLIDTWEEGKLLRDGALVVISGKPNVGKSTLLNALLESERAIVSATPGTTRDSIEEDIVLQGIPIRLVDTAGLRETDCSIEQAGIDRTHSLQKKADLHLYLLDGSQILDAESRKQIESLDSDKALLVLNKSDLGSEKLPEALDLFPKIKTSLIQASGISDLKAFIVEQLASRSDMAARPHALISERHRRLLEEAKAELDTAIDLVKKSAENEVVLAASQLRLALDLIGQATGREYQEELLDAIFSRFCIGK